MKKITLVCLSIYCLLFGSVFGQGTPDPTFGDNGHVGVDLESILGVNFLNLRSQNTVQLNDGSYITYVQYNTNGTNTEQNLFVKLLNTGELDSSFGDNGILLFPSLGDISYAQKIWAKAGEKLLISEYGNIGNGFKFYLRQFNSDGSIDNNFGTNGITQVFQEEVILTNADIDRDERITAVRGKSVSEGTGLQFKRFLANGQIDASFGVNGVSNVSFSNDELIVRDFKLLENGAMFVASSVTNFDGDSLLLLTKHLPSGELDTSFSENGIVTSPILLDFYSRIYLSVFNNEDLLVSLAVLPGSKSNNAYNIIYKLTADGNLDEGFAANGFLNPSNVSNPLIQVNQRFLLLTHDYGDTTLQPRGPFSLRSFYSDGFQDPSVGFQTDPNDYYIIYIDYFVDEDGKILITAPSDTSEALNFYRLSNNPLGIQENTKTSFSVSPNPTNNIVTISCAECALTSKRYQITDTTGKVVQQGAFNVEKPTVSMEGFATGLYYLTIENTTIKVVMQ